MLYVYIVYSNCRAVLWVGQGSMDRVKYSLCPKHAIAKRGSKAAFWKIALETNSRKKALVEEKRLIALLRPKYNRSFGSGCEGMDFTPEHRAKLSVAHRGRKKSPETRARMSSSQKALWTPEWRARFKVTASAVQQAAYARDPDRRDRISIALKLHWANKRAASAREIVR